jgi:hypothetical protein
MNKIYIVIAFLFIGFTCSAQFRIGAGLSSVFSNTTIVGPQLRVQFGVNDRFDFAGSYNFYLNKDSGSAVDFDLRYNLLRIGDTRIKPLGGISYRTVGPGRIHLNAGAVIDFPMSSFRMYIEPKFIIDRQADFAVTVGILL